MASKKRHQAKPVEILRHRPHRKVEERSPSAAQVPEVEPTRLTVPLGEAVVVPVAARQAAAGGE